MDRQLTVWAAPGLVFLVALIAMLSGHLPHGLVPQPAERPMPKVAAAPEPAEPTGGGKSLAELGIPKAPQKPAEKPAEKPADKPAPSEPTDTASKPAGKPAVVYDGPAGVIAGRVLFDGAPPAAKGAITVPEKDAKTCCGDSMDKLDRSLVVSGSGGIADVVVVIKAKGAEASGGGVEVEMDQKCCRYEPHVLVVPKGGTILYRNSDQTNHNVHTYSKKNKALNNNVAAGSSMTGELGKDEVFKVGCDIHPWMSAQVFVTEFATTAVTDADGGFRIEGVPPGEWSVELWHETLGKGKEKVIVAPDSTATVEWLMK